MTREPAETFSAALQRQGGMCFIALPFDPRAVFGKVQAPVRVTLNGYTYESTVAAMGGGAYCVPLRRSHREAAGLDGSETVTVTLQLDAQPRTIAVPADLQAAISAQPEAAQRWHQLSLSHRKEFVQWIEQAKKAETRARRVQATVAKLTA